MKQPTRQEVFVQALHDLHKVQVTFTAKKDGKKRVRTCAPLDFGPRKNAKVPEDLYHVWDYEGSHGPHVAALAPEQINSLEVLDDESFKPEEIVTWNTRESKWHVPRDWGKYSYSGTHGGWQW